MKKFLPIVFATLIILVVASTFVASADENDEKPDCETKCAQMQKMNEKMQEMNEKMRGVMESGDYEAWVELISQDERGSKILEVINEDNFSRFVEAWQLEQEAHEKMEESRAIMEELGIEFHGGKMTGEFRGTLRYNPGMGHLKRQ